MFRIDKSTGYYSKTYKVLSNILEVNSSWFNNCSQEQNIETEKLERILTKG